MVIRVQCTAPVFKNQFIRYQRTDLVITEKGDFAHLMRCAESVKEMNEWNPATKGGSLRNEGKVMRFPAHWLRSAWRIP
jgi:hypothetical protein